MGIGKSLIIHPSVSTACRIRSCAILRDIFFMSLEDLLGQLVDAVPANHPTEDFKNYMTKPSCTIGCDAWK